MIGQLRGLILKKQAPLLLIDVNGVGYEVFSPMSTFYHLPELQQEVQLLTHLIVREDAQTLYGFLQERERELFRALIKVSGIGAKVALSILSGMAPNEFVLCVQSDDATRLTQIPGIGKKTAERLIVELRNTLSQWEQSTTLDNRSENNCLQEAISALTALGYKANEAKRAITKIYKNDHSSEELIRLALQQMVT
ncbi:MAG: Holliday junction branch migration protein RuvA [Coxiellaceae bacterium]|nr:Holliday junction branch migration protein RuvA [Coxiellaceae bacterium]